MDRKSIETRLAILENQLKKYGSPNEFINIDQLLLILSTTNVRSLDSSVGSIDDSIQMITARIQSLESSMSTQIGLLDSNATRLIPLDLIRNKSVDANKKMIAVLDLLRVYDRDTFVIFDATENERLMQSIV